jgi:hypothetical protein
VEGRGRGAVTALRRAFRWASGGLRGRLNPACDALSSMSLLVLPVLVWFAPTMDDEADDNGHP